MSRADLPLKNDIAAHFLPLIIGIMVYLGSLCLVFTLFITQVTRSWEMQFATHLTLEIPTTPHVSGASLQAQVLALLKKTPGIRQASAVPPKDMEKLLRSLLGEETPVDPQSFPILIDVSLQEGALVNTTLLSQNLKSISPQIHLIDDREWQHQIARLINTIVWIASLLTALILCATLITTTFATRTSLLIHRQIIEVLHLIGATNSYIAGQFQRHTLQQGLIASSLGATLACFTFGGLILLLEKAELMSTFDSSFFPQALCVFVFAPFLTSFSMMLTARLTVMRVLHP